MGPHGVSRLLSLNESGRFVDHYFRSTPSIKQDSFSQYKTKVSDSSTAIGMSKHGSTDSLNLSIMFDIMAEQMSHGYCKAARKPDPIKPQHRTKANKGSTLAVIMKKPLPDKGTPKQQIKRRKSVAHQMKTKTKLAPIISG